eukprot:maker-scaffold462_size163801-snap-gene-0.38 protein:Tk04563 transcript:maker-scaffold462_size163801-snap-gene-0.38-mRNA-1 annotation:"heparan-alpha-glucosaminide n-acetyltransferase-like"
MVGGDPEHYLNAIVQCGARVLKLNQACLELVPGAEALEVWAQSAECQNCSFWRLWPPDAWTASPALIVNTSWPTQIEVRVDQREICRQTMHFGEFGRYALDMSDPECRVQSRDPPINTLVPLYVAALVSVGLKLTWMCALKLRRSRRWLNWRWNAGPISSAVNEDLDHSAQLIPDPVPPASQAGPLASSISIIQPLETRRRKPRLRSLDAFRGLAIVMMIFVNYGGAGYWFFHHTPWNGLTVADLVFPWFLWIMGVSIALATRSLLRNSVTRPRLLLRVTKRSLALFLIGIFLNSDGHNDFRTIRIPGVLQRFALSYFFVATLEAIFMHREDPVVQGWRVYVQDITTSLWQWMIMLLCLAVHTALSFGLPVPNCPTGYLGPGGLHHQGQFFNCTGGATGFVDRVVFGPEHMYHHPTAQKIYSTTQPFDPEGLLGCLTSLFLVFLGVVAGRIIINFPSNSDRLARWFMWSLILGLVAGCLCGWSKEGGLIPLNKNLWSLSFVFGTAAMGFLVLGTIPQRKLERAGGYRKPGILKQRVLAVTRIVTLFGLVDKQVGFRQGKPFKSIIQALRVGSGATRGLVGGRGLQ